MIERYDHDRGERPARLRATRSLIASILAWFAVACASVAFAGDRESADPWPSLAQQIFGKRTIADGSGRLSLEAPARAEDAAVVPVSIIITLQQSLQRQVRHLTLVIDQNPSPLAARFELAPNSGIERITTRVRIDDYTNVHAVAELDDGSLLMVKRFVKAAGGCSAPALKQDQDTIARGAMRFRLFPPTGSEPEQAQLMIRHPNYSGMQMDQLTRLYIPAAFVRTVRIWEGEYEVLSIESGISISENPSSASHIIPIARAPSVRKLSIATESTTKGIGRLGANTLRHPGESRGPLETPHFRFGLRLAQIANDLIGLLLSELLR